VQRNLTGPTRELKDEGVLCHQVNRVSNNLRLPCIFASHVSDSYVGIELLDCEDE
jgi:hypothetical protein